MKQYSYSIEINASAEKIWALWSEVETWSHWDPDIKWSRLHGAFNLGVKGELKPQKGPKSTFIITELERHKRFVNVSSLPFAKLIFSHEILPLDTGVKVTHTIHIKGMLSPIFAKLIGQPLSKGLPIALKNLKERAERA